MGSGLKTGREVEDRENSTYDCLLLPLVVTRGQIISDELTLTNRDLLTSGTSSSPIYSLPRGDFRFRQEGDVDGPTNFNPSY